MPISVIKLNDKAALLFVVYITLSMLIFTLLAIFGLIFTDTPPCTTYE